MTNNHKFIHSEGCCICGTKHSTSQFRAWYDHHHEGVYCQVFGLDSMEGRRGMICNPCHLFINRAVKNLDKGNQDNRKRLDSKWKGGMPRVITEILPPCQSDLSPWSLPSGRFVGQLTRPQSNGPSAKTYTLTRRPSYVFTGRTAVRIRSTKFMSYLNLAGPLPDSDKFLDNTVDEDMLYRPVNVKTTSTCSTTTECRASQQDDLTSGSDTDTSSEAELFIKKDGGVFNLAAVTRPRRRVKRAGRNRKNLRPDRQRMKVDLTKTGDAHLPKPTSDWRKKRVLRRPVKNLQLCHKSFMDISYWRKMCHCCATYYFGEGGTVFRQPHPNWGNCQKCKQQPFQQLAQQSQQSPLQLLQRMSRPPSQELVKLSSRQSMQQPALHHGRKAVRSRLSFCDEQDQDLGVGGVLKGPVVDQEDGSSTMSSGDDEVNESRTTSSPLAIMELSPYLTERQMDAKLNAKFMASMKIQ